MFDKLLSDQNTRELSLVETGLECLKNNKQIPFTLKMSLEQIHCVRLTSDKLENQRALTAALETLTGVQKVIAGGFLAVVIGMLIKFFTGGGGVQ